jgi:hypothetical protein
VAGCLVLLQVAYSGVMQFSLYLRWRILGTRKPFVLTKKA